MVAPREAQVRGHACPMSACASHAIDKAESNHQLGLQSPCCLRLVDHYITDGSFPVTACILADLRCRRGCGRVTGPDRVPDDLFAAVALGTDLRAARGVRHRFVAVLGEAAATPRSPSGLMICWVRLGVARSAPSESTIRGGRRFLHTQLRRVCRALTRIKRQSPRGVQAFGNVPRGHALGAIWSVQRQDLEQSNIRTKMRISAHILFTQAAPSSREVSSPRV
jgi:hypothetical protein